MCHLSPISRTAGKQTEYVLLAILMRLDLHRTLSYVVYDGLVVTRMSASDMLNNYYCATSKRVENYELCQRALYAHYRDCYLLYDPGFRAPRNSPISEDRGEPWRFQSANFEVEQMAWTLVRGPPTGIPTTYNAEEAAIYLQSQALRCKIVKKKTAAKQEAEDAKVALQLQSKINKPPKQKKNKTKPIVLDSDNEDDNFDDHYDDTDTGDTSQALAAQPKTRLSDPPTSDVRELRAKYSSLERSLYQLQQSGLDSNLRLKESIEGLRFDFKNQNSTLNSQRNSQGKTLPFFHHFVLDLLDSRYNRHSVSRRIGRGVRAQN